MKSFEAQCNADCAIMNFNVHLSESPIISNYVHMPLAGRGCKASLTPIHTGSKENAKIPLAASVWLNVNVV